MVLAIPGGCGLFSHLQLALCHTNRTRVRLTQQVQDQLEDFWELAQDVTSRPTHISEIIPTTPTQVGACDAAKSGVGGVWLPPDYSPHEVNPAQLPPILWHATWPAHIQSQLVTDANPHGTLTNSDLELAGAILHQQDVITDHASCREATTHTMCDNVTAIAWHRRGSVTNTAPDPTFCVSLLSISGTMVTFPSCFTFPDHPIQLRMMAPAFITCLTHNFLLSLTSPIPRGSLGTL
jgi:hypothetical protein